jgi:hypothetical protein
LEAIRHNNFALQYVHSQTEEICLEAIGRVVDPLVYEYHDKIMANILQYVDEILYRPNSVYVLVSQTRWHMSVDAKTVFLFV